MSCRKITSFLKNAFKKETKYYKGIYSFSPEGYLHIDGDRLMESPGYKATLKEARELSKVLNLPKSFNSPSF